MGGRQLSARYSASLPLELFCRGFHRCNRRFPGSVHSSMFTPIAISPRCCSRANEESAPTRASSCLEQAANTISAKAETWSARTLRLPPARFGQLTRDPSIEGGIRRLVLLFQRYRGKLECVKNVAEVELRDCRDSLAIVIHARGRAESG